MDPCAGSVAEGTTVWATQVAAPRAARARMTGVRSGARASGRRPSRLKTMARSGEGRRVGVGGKVGDGSGSGMDVEVGGSVGRTRGSVDVGRAGAGAAQAARSSPTSRLRAARRRAKGDPALLGAACPCLLGEACPCLRGAACPCWLGTATSAFLDEVVAEIDYLPHECIEVLAPAPMVGNGAPQREATMQHRS